MKTLHFTNTGIENLPFNSRLLRALIGAGLILFVMTTPDAPLGWYVLLPLLSIFPIFSAISGWDPVKAFFQHPGVVARLLPFSNPVRYSVGAVGVALIGSVYVASYWGATLGLLAILPIVGVYPVFAAIAGMDPITALYNMDRQWPAQQAENTTEELRPAALEVIKGRKTALGENNVSENNVSEDNVSEDNVSQTKASQAKPRSQAA